MFQHKELRLAYAASFCDASFESQQDHWGSCVRPAVGQVFASIFTFHSLLCSHKHRISRATRLRESSHKPLWRSRWALARHDHDLFRLTRTLGVTME
jgi:hypothetical protein